MFWDGLAALSPLKHNDVHLIYGNERRAMLQTRIILLISTAPAIIDLVTATLSSDLETTVVLDAYTGAEAINMALTQPLSLVVLDLDFGGDVGGEHIGLKLRALRPTLPILPIGAGLEAASLLAEVGCAPILTKALLIANPASLLNRITMAMQHAPVIRVPEGTFSYLVEQADAVLRAEPRYDQLDVVLVCRNVLLRCGFMHALTSLGIRVHLATTDHDAIPLDDPPSPGARLLIGPFSDITPLQALARTCGLPVLLIALQQHELEPTTYATLAGASVILVDAAGDIRQLLAALQSVAAGDTVLAVPPGIIARWVAPLGTLTPREWEVIVAMLLSTDVAAVAQICGLLIPSVETYIKRVRRKLGARSLPATLMLVQTHLIEQLGVNPSAAYRPAVSARMMG
jgi:DNA-binding NarL/FixJ family response regulator